MNDLPPAIERTRWCGVYLQCERRDGVDHWWIAADDGTEEYRGTTKPTDGDVESFVEFATGL